jgi:hypothetical protein
MRLSVPATEKPAQIVQIVRWLREFPGVGHVELLILTLPPGTIFTMPT